jgi:16S rRNA (guanine(966)-N(2))-methyltransferase RsmD
MRVIAGTAKGRTLRAPAGRRVRPTADRIKESLFGILGERVTGSRVLDLYAGAGSLAIEALSRGAGEAVIVESWPAAVAAIRANLGATRFTGRARVIRARSEEAVRSVLERGSTFDLIFMDPPYRMSASELEKVFTSLHERDLLTSHSVLVLEGSSKKTPQEFAGFVVKSFRVYGDTSLTFYAKSDVRREGV